MYNINDKKHRKTDKESNQMKNVINFTFILQKLFLLIQT